MSPPRKSEKAKYGSLYGIAKELYDTEYFLAGSPGFETTCLYGEVIPMDQPRRVLTFRKRRSSYAETIPVMLCKEHYEKDTGNPVGTMAKWQQARGVA